MKIKIVKLLSGINPVFLMAVVSALDTETIGADVFTACMLLSIALGVVLMHILEHLKRKERRRREYARRNKPFVRTCEKRRKRA